MPIEQKPVRQVQYDYRCDKCGQGHYRPFGGAKLSAPPQFEHHCNSCGDKKIFYVTFPLTRLVAEGEDPSIEEILKPPRSVQYPNRNLGM